MSKSISRFRPVVQQSPAESERHYVEVHVPFAQRMLRGKPQVITYHTNLVVGEYDVRGRWQQSPTAWRFVVLTFEEGASLAFTDDEKRIVSNDHRNCLQELRACSVAERVMFDQLSGQTSLAKYLFEFDRRPDTPHDEAKQHIEHIAERFLEAAHGAFGLRRVILNHVLSEAVTEPLDQEGQLITGRLRPDTDKTAYLEVYFDNDDWGGDLFEQPAIRELLADRCFAVAKGYLVDERCGLDRR
ncbi:MAG: hypothetical protein ACE5E8_03805 [Acidimicrobiia bacterium]